MSQSIFQISVYVAYNAKHVLGGSDARACARVSRAFRFRRAVNARRISTSR